MLLKGPISPTKQEMEALFEKYAFDGVIHLAAESHVDRSILDPLAFVKTNVLGTAVLLNTCRKHWKDNLTGKLFYHVSTDEVYGSLGEEGFFTEETPYDPRSPYSASKAASDHFVMAYYHTYGFAGSAEQLFQQLRLTSFSRKADPVNDQQYQEQQTFAGIWQR